MPKMDEFEFLKKVREELKGFDNPIITLTNSSDENNLQTAMSLGVEDYIIKADWKLEDIINRIKDKIKTSQQSKND
ncbi:MAG: response regulator [Candidatus Moraniibacteriota bacterium]